MTTVPERFGCAQRAILDFSRQAHLDRELIVVVKSKNLASALRNFVDTYCDSDVGDKIYIYSRAVNSSQDAYVAALCHASGELITFWDDENLNDPDRLDHQVLNTNFAGKATVYDTAVYLFYETREIYFVALRGSDAMTPALASTVMLPRKQLPYLSPGARGFLPSRIVQDAQTLSLLTLPYVHLVGVSGNNQRNNHRTLATMYSLSSEQLTLRQDSLRETLKAFPLDAGDYLVCSPDGGVFTWTPSQLNPTHLNPIQINEASEVVSKGYKDVGGGDE